MLLVTAAQMRRLDALTIERYGTPGYTLMQRAGRGAAEVLRQTLPPGRRRVVVCAGRGNNGGDGFVIGRELKRQGASVEAFLLGEPGQVTGDAARALASFRRIRGKVVPCTDARGLDALQRRLDGAGVVVDALFGTGLKGDVRGLAADAIELINACGVPVFAVDIPSGLHGDRGVPLGAAVQAEVTATFGFAKVGHVVHPGVEHVGRLAVVDIGIAAEAIEEVRPDTVLLDEEELGALVPRRTAVAHKGDAGHVLVIAGSRGKTGAAVLAALGAARAGAGLVTIAAPRSEQRVIAAGMLEAMTECLPDRDGHLSFDGRALRRLSEGKKAIVFGPGVGTGPGARETLRWLLAHASAPLVVDADGLNCAALDPDAIAAARAEVVLTPHPGEMSRLTRRSTSEIQADRLGAARQLAAAGRCTVALKGAGTVVADAAGSAAVNPTGNPGMASGGMGDVLAGVVGGLLAQGLSPASATRLGVFVHGRAADRAVSVGGAIGLIASDVVGEVPRALRELSEWPGE